MSFKDKYTTASIKAKEGVKEKDKTVLSEDAMAIGELLECLINKTG